MDLKTLCPINYTTLHEQDIDGELLLVKETADYRWFEYGGPAIQSLMDRAHPEQLLTPVFQSLLLFLLLKDSPLRLLNLGMGGGAIERSLTKIPTISVTSVESSQAIIDIAQRYFDVPKHTQVICQKAECFIEQTSAQYDVVLCDLFVDNKNPDFLFTEGFYRQLKVITSANAVLMINLQVDTEQALLSAVLAIKKHFPYVALIEFEDYKNVVVMGSAQPIPEVSGLLLRIKNFNVFDFTDLNKMIERMHYIPNGE